VLLVRNATAIHQLFVTELRGENVCVEVTAPASLCEPIRTISSLIGSAESILPVNHSCFGLSIFFLQNPALVFFSAFFRLPHRTAALTASQVLGSTFYTVSSSKVSFFFMLQFVCSLYTAWDNLLPEEYIGNE